MTKDGQTRCLRRWSFVFCRQEDHVETQELKSRIAAVEERITAAARRAGRDPAEVMLVAVSKTHTPVEVAAAYAASSKPLLVHCSAGIDRTGAVIDHLVVKTLG